MLKLFNKTRKPLQDRGFTLIELLVVITIIGILATIVMVSVNSARVKARDVRRIADLRQVALALEMYFDDNPISGYPGSAGMNDWATMKPCLEGTGAAPCDIRYISTVPHDPAGFNDYEYWIASDEQTFVLKATLEDPNNHALDDDVDGPVFGCDCGTSPNDPEGYYCLLW